MFSCVSTSLLFSPPSSTHITGLRALAISNRLFVFNGQFTAKLLPSWASKRFHSAMAAVTRNPCCSSMRSPNQVSRHSVRLLHQVSTMEHRAFIALGSNLGDRVSMIEEACKHMDQSGKVRLLRTSSLWETKAMYVLDQDKFVNGVCEVSAAH
jgi:hypothetical protein